MLPPLLLRRLVKLPQPDEIVPIWQLHKIDQFQVHSYYYDLRMGMQAISASRRSCLAQEEEIRIFQKREETETKKHEEMK